MASIFTPLLPASPDSLPEPYLSLLRRWGFYPPPGARCGDERLRPSLEVADGGRIVPRFPGGQPPGLESRILSDHPMGRWWRAGIVQLLLLWRPDSDLLPHVLREPGPLVWCWRVAPRFRPRTRHGQGTLEMIVSVLGFAGLMFVTTHVLDQSRTRLQVEVAREAFGSSLANRSDPAPASRLLSEAWSLAPEVSIREGGCDASTVEVGVGALDGSLHQTDVHIRQDSTFGLLGESIRIEEGLCVTQGFFHILEVGGGILDKDPDPWLHGADQRLSPLFQ